MSNTRGSTTKLLFVGNSFTARNNLPGLIVALAAARGVQVDSRLLSIGGASLRTHWNKGEARAAIESGEFDYVVLQEQSTLPIKNAARMRENVLLFDPVIRKAGAQVVLYMTWARKHAPESQRAITEAYESIGQEINALVVPVGVAWQRCLKQHRTPTLHDKDQSHPSIAGSYLAACVFLITLFRASPVGVSSEVARLTADDVRLLQMAAQDVAG